MDLTVEIPRSPLEAVMAHEVWEEYHDRLAALIQAHRTTLIFVNTRRLAERLARHLSERLGEDAVTAHHGSLSKDKRLDAETRLKSGSLRALVATASLELGIDIGHVDLVCQIGSPHRIATLLQRVGRSGHTISGTAEGPGVSDSRWTIWSSARRSSVVCAAATSTRSSRMTRRSTCWRSKSSPKPPVRSTDDDDMYALVRRAWPYRDLSRSDFQAVVAMAADGFSTRRGRRAALIHRDEVNARLRGRRGARLLAQTSGGAIPEIADYRVVLDPDDTFIGTLNEDFAIESTGGDVFQLGNASWRVLQVTTGTVRVADAKGAPPNIPFWLGEAPARSDELSEAVSALRKDVDGRLASSQGEPSALIDWLTAESGLSRDAADQALAYLADGRRTLGVIPSQDTLVLERFFDESGGMQLVLHAPFGSRVNKAWGLALRKRFCRQFNFELQAAATDDALMLSLGPQHSFPLSDVFRYLHPETTRDVLVQAFLDAPVFETRWRWNATLSLAVPRTRGGRKLAPQVQRMLAADLLASVFPDAAACLENIPGDREIPDHPLVNQTVRDCLEEAMDFEGLRGVLKRIHGGHLRLVARDTPEPSAFAHEILNAKPYAFLDDAPLEERRSHAVQTRRGGSGADDLGTLDAAAIERVRDEVRPDPRDPDELHDALMTSGFLAESEADAAAAPMFRALASQGRACTVRLPPPREALRRDFAIWVAAERIRELLAIHPDAVLEPIVQAPASRDRAWDRDRAIAEFVRGRLTTVGPTTAEELAQSFGVDVKDIDDALLALESEGVVLRGRFRAGMGEARTTEWCDRTLLARIHRYTLNRLRAEIEPVTPADFMRFLFKWQHVDVPDRLVGIDGLREVLGMLDGFELGGGAWERAVLPARVQQYETSLLDLLCLTGEVAWARLSDATATARLQTATPPEPIRLTPATPVALFLREHADAWQALRSAAADPGARLNDNARRVLDVLRERGASFFGDLRSACSLGLDETRLALGMLVASGLAASDGFSGLRALIKRAPNRFSIGTHAANFSGRWAIIASGSERSRYDDAVETQAWALLRRYGVVFRRILTRESVAAPWRDLTRVYRRLEARGEIRGGRFVSGMSGEQFALPLAIERLREVRRSPADGRLQTISTADPLNLAGIVTSGDRIRAAARNRLIYRDGVPLAVLEGEVVRELASIEPSIAADVSRALRRRGHSPVTVHG